MLSAGSKDAIEHLVCRKGKLQSQHPEKLQEPSSTILKEAGQYLPAIPL
jgi:hypothetical protein